MRSFFIKLGKVLNALKRDGFFNGARKILNYAAVYLENIFIFGSGDILIITAGVGDSARYRARNVAEELEIHGFRCAVAMQDSPLLAAAANKFKVFIFHKTLFTPKVKKLVENIKMQDKEIIFETDDLVFDKEFIKDMDYFKNINSLEKKQYEGGVGAEILNDAYVKVCTTTNSFLAEKLKEYNKKVFVLPNKLSAGDLEIVEKILAAKNQQPKTNDLKIGYFSGTISHNKDFAAISDALMEIMEKYPQVRLFLAGPLDIESKLNKFAGRIEKIPFASRKKHFENISGTDINIAPLEVSNPFCEARSELKFFEAGILGVPTVASATQTFREAIEDGVDGFIASTTGEWVEKLGKLVADKNLRETMGKKAREKTLQKYATKNSRGEEYYNYLKSCLIKHETYNK